MTEESLPRGGYVLLGKDTMERCQEAAGKHGMLAMMALLWYADNETGSCWPTIQTLAQRAGITARTLRETLRKLRDAELITWVDRSAEGRPHLFTITQTIHTRTIVGPVEKDSGGVGRKRQARGVVKTPPELNPPTTRLRSGRTVAEITSHFAEVWDLYGRKDTSRKRALAAWQKEAREDRLPPQDQLLDQVERYRRHTFQGRPEEKARMFLKHPERWLREQCYLSEYPDTYQGGPGAGGRLQPAYEPGEAGEEPAF